MRCSRSSIALILGVLTVQTFGKPTEEAAGTAVSKVGANDVSKAPADGDVHESRDILDDDGKKIGKFVLDRKVSRDGHLRSTSAQTKIEKPGQSMRYSSYHSVQKGGAADAPAPAFEAPDLRVFTHGLADDFGRMRANMADDFRRMKDGMFGGWGVDDPTRSMFDESTEDSSEESPADPVDSPSLLNGGELAVQNLEDADSMKTIQKKSQDILDREGKVIGQKNFVTKRGQRQDGTDVFMKKFESHAGDKTRHGSWSSYSSSSVTRSSNAGGQARRMGLSRRSDPAQMDSEGSWMDSIF